MRINLNPYERGIRVVLGALLLTAAFFNPSELWYFVGLLPLITGAAGMCPVYKILNFSSKKV